MSRPVGKALAAFYPTPTNATPTGQIPANNYNFNQAQLDTLNLGSMRVDHTFSAKDTLYGSYNHFAKKQISQKNVVCVNHGVPRFSFTPDLLASPLCATRNSHVH